MYISAIRLCFAESDLEWSKNWNALKSVTSGFRSPLSQKDVKATLRGDSGYVTLRYSPLGASGNPRSLKQIWFSDTKRSKGVTLDHVMWGLERRPQTNLR